ncbi:MAG: TolC family protein, partial [Gemmatimonadetes bacterium]|nr:TolC family protein [Gemmatimonadota bacterium]
WSIFDGFLTQGRVQQARARATQIDLALVDLHNRVDRQVRDAARQLDAAQQRAEVAATAIASAQEHLRVTRIEYDHGIVTTTELLDAEVVRRSAQLRLLQAIHDVRISKARQQFALGTSLNL